MNNGANISLAPRADLTIPCVRSAQPFDNDNEPDWREAEAA